MRVVVLAGTRLSQVGVDDPQALRELRATVEPLGARVLLVPDERLIAILEAAEAPPPPSPAPKQPPEG